jgi:hypothetical protein
MCHHYNCTVAALLPMNAASPVASTAIKLICLIIISYLLLFYKTVVASFICGICHLVYIKVDMYVLGQTSSSIIGVKQPKSRQSSQKRVYSYSYFWLHVM